MRGRHQRRHRRCQAPRQSPGQGERQEETGQLHRSEPNSGDVDAACFLTQGLLARLGGIRAYIAPRDFPVGPRVRLALFLPFRRDFLGWTTGFEPATAWTTNRAIRRNEALFSRSGCGSDLLPPNGSCDVGPRGWTRWGLDPRPTAGRRHMRCLMRALRPAAFGGDRLQVVADPARQKRIDHSRPLESTGVDQVERVGMFDVAGRPAHLDPELAPHRP